MKKWLSLLGLALNFTGFCYGMDLATQTRLELFKESVAVKNWPFVAMSFMSDIHSLRPHYEQVLLAQTSDDLNIILVAGGEGLFESLFNEYVIARDAKKDYFKTLLKKLILHGLDYKVQRNGRYVYKYYGNSTVPLESRTKKFLEMVGELVRENPDKVSQLCSGFESEIASSMVSVVQPPVAHTQQNQVQDQQQPTHDNAPAQKEKTIFNKKISRTGLYLVLGCAVLAIGYQVYKRYTQNKVDDDKEEANDPEATIAKDTV